MDNGNSPQNKQYKRKNAIVILTTKINVPVWLMTMIKIDNQRIGSNFQGTGSFNAIYSRINKNGRIKIEGRYDKNSRAADGIDIRKSNAIIRCSFDSRNVPEYR
jgi:hypothetical protein